MGYFTFLHPIKTYPWEVFAMSATLKDIARETNLSVTTVSLVLNKKPCRVSDATRELILKTAEKMNYYPNQLAVGLVKQQSNTIGLIIPDISNHFYSNLALGMDAEMNNHNKNIILLNTDFDAEKLVRGINVLKSRGVDAIILTAASLSPKNLSLYSDLLSNVRVPVVTVDHYYPELHCSAVQLNNRKGAYIAVKHLIDYGHTDIACITGPKHSTVTLERLEGYRLAMKEAGLSLPEKYMFCGNYRQEGGARAAEEILRSTKATAIFAFNDVMALGACQTLKEHAVSIPDDISIVGFDNIDFSGMLAVPLTTVNQPAYEIGQEAARQALLEIEHPDIEKRTITFEPHLIIRSSTKPRASKN